MDDILEARFRGIDLASIHRFVAEGQEENLHLEFKTVKSPNLKSDDDKRNLTRSLSGFANSDGGLVVWGVTAKKGANEVDCATDLAPVADAALLLSRLNELTSDLVSPMVDGVEHRLVLEGGGPSGYAVSHVPRSDIGPHMASDNRYYKRSGDSFVRLEHFDVADMFGRRAHPVLRLVGRVHFGGGYRRANGVTHLDFEVIFAIENTGRGSAYAPYVAVDVCDSYAVSQYGIDGNMNEGLPRLPSRRPDVVVYGARADTVIHPGTTCDVFAVKGDLVAGLTYLPDLLVAYQLAADGAPLRTDTVRITGSEMVRVVSATASS